MKIISYNVNGIRTRFSHIDRVIKKYNPDILCLQETKVQDNDFPLEFFSELGYNVCYYGQPTHRGVAIVSKNKPNIIQYGLNNITLDEEKRMIGIEYENNNKKYFIINSYFPQGENRNHLKKFPYKIAYYGVITKFIEEKSKQYDNVLICGDMNISYEDIDIGIGEDNKKRWLKTGKCSFLPEEREMLKKIFDLGFYDSFRILNPKTDDLFSWFDYRSFGFEKEPKRGLRIDLILCSNSLKSHCKESLIDYEIRAMERPSDHCPIYAEFI